MQSRAHGLNRRFVPGGDPHSRFVIDPDRQHLRGEFQDNGSNPSKFRGGRSVIGGADNAIVERIRCAIGQRTEVQA